MRVESGRTSRAGRFSRLVRGSALACVLALAATHADAQDFNLPSVADLSRDGELLLEADTLIVDTDTNTITVAGAVQIDYDGYRLVARRVIYDRNTSRLLALGGVEIVDREGTVIRAERIDVTDDFRDGFVEALRVETIDRIYFAADSAERRDGEVTTFNRGVYTACAPCEARPDKPPSWRIKSQRIVWDGRTETVRFERARFELFGMPLATLPAFEIPDPTVRRKSGFLFPTFAASSGTGFGVRVPYYFALSPSYDLTVYGSGYTRQGFLGEAEWRQRFESGEYSLRMAGISQASPGAFDRETVDHTRLRGMIGSQGRFRINPRWAFGWDALVQSDKNFSRRYDIEGYSAADYRSQVFLTGIDDRNRFDLRFMRFHVQETDRAGFSSNTRHEYQPWVLPSLDYTRIADQPVAGGELAFNVNMQGIYRDRLDDVSETGVGLVRGIDGTSLRATAETEWKRMLIAPGGVVFTPILHARSDAIAVDYRGASRARIADVADYINAQGDLGSARADMRSDYYRTMVTAGLEARWPVLFTTSGSNHVVEPIGQIFARPDAPYADRLGIPNEDAQSLVFDATSLFDRDKFSGYDRIEGGVRANVGLRYSGSMDNGWAVNAIFGQSFHLAGDNPYAQPDLVHAGAYSGLETDRSDRVGQIGVTSPGGLSLAAGGRFDEEDFAIRRTDVTAGYVSQPLSVLARYAYIEAQPHYGFSEDRREVQLSASTRVSDFWRVFGSGTFDFENSVLVSRSIGFAYDDECLVFGLSYKENENAFTGKVTRNVGFTLSLRTLGDLGSRQDGFEDFAGFGG